MLDYTLPADKLAELRAAHRRTHDKREADRLKAIILLATGWVAEDVAEALLVDPNTVRNCFRRYQQDGLGGLRDAAYRGSACELSDAELVSLDLHVQAHLYLTAKDIAAWVAEQFGVTYTASGMTALLHRLGFVYKKPKLVPGKADPKAQEAFLAEYEKLKQDKGENDVICFMDAVHPQHNPVIGYGWIKRGEAHEVRTNSGRARVDINGHDTIVTTKTDRSARDLPLPPRELAMIKAMRAMHLRERLAVGDVPEPFKGPAIALITAGLMSLAFMGFAGLV
jgi:transposase